MSIVLAARLTVSVDENEVDQGKHRCSAHHGAERVSGVRRGEKPCTRGNGFSCADTREQETEAAEKDAVS